MMRYGRDYGDRGFLGRAANTVRGWLGHGPGYDGAFRDRGWQEGHGGYRRDYDAGARGGMGYGGGSWSGRNADWDRTPSRAGQGYRTGGYQPQHGAWDVDWDEGGRGMSGGGMRGGGYDRGGRMGDGYDRGYREGRDVMALRPDPRDDFRARGVRMSGDGMDRGLRRGPYDQDMNRSGGGMGGGMLGSQSGAYGFDRFRSNYGSGFGSQYYTGYGTGSPRG